jgi:NhaA family Na+:H+ antiporter
MTVLRSMKDFSSMNITASILLFVTAIAAAVIANSPAASVYQEFLSHDFIFASEALIYFRMRDTI